MLWRPVVLCPCVFVFARSILRLSDARLISFCVISCCEYHPIHSENNVQAYVRNSTGRTVY